jgi:hypothetical protein
MTTPEYPSTRQHDQVFLSGRDYAYKYQYLYRTSELESQYVSHFFIHYSTFFKNRHTT